MGQLAYIWHDKALGAFKIGKTDDEKRFINRCKEALGGNPHILFLGVWQTNILKPQDAGTELAQPFDRVNFGTGAREWYRADSGRTLVRRASDLFGAPKYVELPRAILDHSPWDPFGNVPSRGLGASRLWLHQERRSDAYLKLSDNSWWTPNLKVTWNNTFNPSGFDLISAFEWPALATRVGEWAQLNVTARQIKFSAQKNFGLLETPRVAQVGWLRASVKDIVHFLEAQGLVRFDPKDGLRPGVNGQGKKF